MNDLPDVSMRVRLRQGTPEAVGTCTAANRIDYILLSPALFAKVTGGGIFRMGAWGGKNDSLWPHYDTVTKATDAASDHAAMYADIRLT
ncbi:MAG: hypothetical protein QOE40_1296, partial [Actinomycetota bacterium]|jgi:hypothetical protein|nr:hypothetical protein [Actinomycetota bacterium]